MCANIVLTVEDDGCRKMMNRYKAPLGCVSIGGKELEVMADSGSPITILDKDKFEKVWKNMKLEKSDVNPKAFGEFDINIVGYFCDTLKFKSRSIDTKIYVAENGRNIVGWQDLGRLGIILKPGSTNPIILGDIPCSDVNSVEDTDMYLTLEKVLTDNQDVFANHIGCVKGFEHEIKLKATATPVIHKVRPVPLSVRKELKDLLKKLCDEGVIECTDSSEWVSAIVITKKKTGDIRLCADLRSLNRNIVVDCHPLPRIQEILAPTNGSRYFSLIDLKSAYHQVKLCESSKDYTTFVTPFGAYRYVRLPFGLASAASVFQKLMDFLFQDMDGIEKFQDDILVHSKTSSEHNVILNKVLSILRERGMTVSRSKCKFLCTEIEYFGHTLSADGIKPKEDLLKAIREVPRPKNKDTLKSFLGLSEYYSRFIMDYAGMVEPLRKLLRKKVKFEWSHEQETAFINVTNAILKAPALQHYDTKGRNRITVDASATGIGAVFTQIVSGKEVTVAFVSRMLRKSECFYSTIEREALACVWAVEKLKTYLWGNEFELVTDHKPLEYMMDGRSNAKASSRLIRLLSKLQEYNFVIKHIFGGLNRRADCLSRLPLEDDDHRIFLDDECIVAYMDVVEHCDGAISAEERCKASESDSVLQQVMKYVTEGWPPSRNVGNVLNNFSQVADELSIECGILMRHDLYVPPQALKKRLIELAHKGHPGTSLTKKALRSYYWWPGLDNYVNLYLDNCVESIRSDKHWKLSKKELQPVLIPDAPWEKIAIDISGPFTLLESDMRYLIVVTDYYSKWIHWEFLSNVSTETVIEFLRKIFAIEGLPRILVSDNGTQLTSQKMCEFLECHGIRQEKSPLYNPSSNGQVERMNRFMKEGIQLALASK
ncbi:gypsy retrotransposon integrase-like protein 1 [Pleurodeles waltl]|uniref:gypsy retrotransposon integrase-like protein 1 n=1 Tax=Pleurodeles waltl TaxID=8319 RepID=UPI0037095AC1